MIQKKLVDEISINFPQLFIIGNYVKIRFENKGSPCYFVSAKGQVTLQKLNERGYFCLNS